MVPATGEGEASDHELQQAPIRGEGGRSAAATCRGRQDVMACKNDQCLVPLCSEAPEAPRRSNAAADSYLNMRSCGVLVAVAACVFGSEAILLHGNASGSAFMLVAGVSSAEEMCLRENAGKIGLEACSSGVAAGDGMLS